MFGTLPKSAILIPGYSESQAVCEPLANALSDPHTGIVDDIHVITAGEFHDRPISLAGKLLITHSGGILEPRGADAVIALQAPEPTSLPRLIFRAAKVAFEHIDHEPGLPEGIASFKHPFLELCAHRFTPWIPFGVRTFSASERLASAHDDFPGGRMMLQADDDTFGFTRPEALALAQQGGVVAQVVAAKHNSALFRPREAVSYIKAALDSANS